MSYVWGERIITVSSTQTGLPRITRVEIESVNPPNPVVGQDVNFTILIWFDRKLPAPTQIEVVMAMPMCTATGCAPCSADYIFEKKTMTAPSGIDALKVTWTIRFGSPGKVKVCFGARVLGLMTR